MEQNSRHGEGESLELKEVRSIVDPSTALKPVLVTFDLHIGGLKILYYNTYVTHAQGLSHTIRLKTHETNSKEKSRRQRKTEDS